MMPLAIKLGAETLQFQHAQFNSPGKVALHNTVSFPRKGKEFRAGYGFPFHL